MADAQPTPPSAPAPVDNPKRDEQMSDPTTPDPAGAVLEICAELGIDVHPWQANVIRAVFADPHRTGPVFGSVGRCGDAASSIGPHTRTYCALPAGHAGWHRDDNTPPTEWRPLPPVHTPLTTNCTPPCPGHTHPV